LAAVREKPRLTEEDTMSVSGARAALRKLHGGARFDAFADAVPMAQIDGFFRDAPGRHAC
jgi:hypothetical protein